MESNLFWATRAYIQEDDWSFEDGPADRAILQRRTILNWPTAMQGDIETFEIIEQATRAELVEAHRSLGVLPRSPVGLINSLSRPQEKFASTPEVRGV
jgi:hypothetical protein